MCYHSAYNVEDAVPCPIPAYSCPAPREATSNSDSWWMLELASAFENARLYHQFLSFKGVIYWFYTPR